MPASSPETRREGKFMSSSPTPDGHVVPEEISAEEPYTGTSRRRFVGYVLAAPTLAAAAQLSFDSVSPARASAASGAVPIPSTLQQFDVYDLSDLLSDSCKPTNNLLIVTVDSEGFAHFDIPRAEVGQGLTTSIPMIIADEMDLPLNKVKVTLANARPELLYNQLTGGSNSIHSMYDQLRATSAVARTQLTMTAAKEWGVALSEVSTKDGVVHGPAGQSLSYGELAVRSAVPVQTEVPFVLKTRAQQSIIGSRVTRLDALAAITGAKKFAMDLKVPNALPTMVCHAPTLFGTPAALLNESAIKAMNGVTDVGLISTGVAVRARTFGQCIDAVRAMKVRWNAGTVDNYDNAKVIQELKAAELPLEPAAPIPGQSVIEHTFVFNSRSGSALETNCAVADVRSGSAEIWSSLKNPIIAQQRFAEFLGLAVDKVTVHVPDGGGSFGRKLFHNQAQEAVEASKMFGKPVKLMWHRTEDSRHGRAKAPAVAHMRATTYDKSVTSFVHRHTAAATDYTHGLGEIYSGMAASIKGPISQAGGNFSVAEGIFQLSANIPYNFGQVEQLLNEIYDYDKFATQSVRNVYSPEINTARELMVDEIGKKFGLDPLEMRLQFVKDSRARGVLEMAAEKGNWGRKMAPGTAQAIAVHNEYKARVACLMEIDTRPQTVNRKIRDAYTGARITKVVMAVDAGTIVNPAGYEAMMMGGAMDGIANALTASLHWEKGLPLEGSWDDYRYTRQWNAPLSFEAFFVPGSVETPGGAGELGCGVSQAAAACAYGRATGTMPTEFPINFHKPLGFKVKSKSPAYPQSPTNGLRFAR
jgi:isoquinoline 1-oxidoreductase beta subunit